MSKLLKNNGTDEYERKVTKEVFADWWREAGETAFVNWAKNAGVEDRFTKVEINQKYDRKGMLI